MNANTSPHILFFSALSPAPNEIHELIKKKKKPKTKGFTSNEKLPNDNSQLTKKQSVRRQLIL